MFSNSFSRVKFVLILEPKYFSLFFEVIRTECYEEGNIPILFFIHRIVQRISSEDIELICTSVHTYWMILVLWKTSLNLYSNFWKFQLVSQKSFINSYNLNGFFIDNLPRDISEISSLLSNIKRNFYVY